MPILRIWALESDYDRDAVGRFAEGFAELMGLDDVIIRTAGKTTFNSIVKRRKPDALQIAVESYLKNQEDKVVFVFDSDSEAALAAKRREPRSFINQIEKLLQSGRFVNRVLLAMAVQELEAWLLADCVGVCCYFARTRYSKDECRERIAHLENLRTLIAKHQKGNTELIVEAVRGGRGAKEYWQ